MGNLQKQKGRRRLLTKKTSELCSQECFFVGLFCPLFFFCRFFCWNQFSSVFIDFEENLH